MLWLNDSNKSEAVGNFKKRECYADLWDRRDYGDVCYYITTANKMIPQLDWKVR